MKLLPKRLAQQLILFLAVVAGITAGVSGYLQVRTQERQIVGAMITGADQLSRSITSATWHSMLADHRSDAYDQMKTIASKQGIDRIRIFNKEGRVMFSTSPDDPKQVDKNAEACFLCHASERPLVKVDVPSRARTFRGVDGERKLGMITPIYNEPSCSEAACHAHPAEMRVLGVLDVSMRLDTVDRELAGSRLRVVLLTLLHIGLVSVVTILFTRHFVAEPITRLIEGTRAFGTNQPGPPIRISTSEEFGELAGSFNAMRERLSEQIAVINQFTHSLESKVEERTEQLRAAHEKLMQGDRLASLGQLSATVAHEINNPISGILNLSMLMERILKADGIPPERIEEFRGYLAQVTSETGRVGRIVSDLLAFSRRARPMSASTDLNGVVRSTLSLLDHKLRLGNVTVHLDLDPDLPSVFCDASQIQQVLINLVMNGAEATQGRGQGQVGIRTRRSPGAGKVIIEVTDDGVGIAPEILPRIFDPFFTTKGLGLGLSVVYGIVEAHGGEVEVMSRVGRGSTFRVTLPLAGAEAAAHESGSPPGEGGG